MAREIPQYDLSHAEKRDRIKPIEQVPVTTSESDALSKDLKKRGFRFVGSTIIYAYMQAVGLVNDHTEDCFHSRKRVR
jgi:DNA-3-methyladenine glycosylase I